MDFYTVNCKFIDDYIHTRDRKPDYPGNQPASIKKHQLPDAQNYQICHCV